MTTDTITYSETAAHGSSLRWAWPSPSPAATLAALCADAEFVFGKLMQVEADGMCVIERGYVTLPGGTGAALTRGKACRGRPAGVRQRVHPRSSYRHGR
jgi:hypothetical protein